MESAHERNGPRSQETYRLAEILREIGWLSPCDAQWEHLEAAIPLIREALAVFFPSREQIARAIQRVEHAGWNTWESSKQSDRALRQADAVRALLSSPADIPIASPGSAENILYELSCETQNIARPEDAEAILVEYIKRANEWAVRRAATFPFSEGKADG